MAGVLVSNRRVPSVRAVAVTTCELALIGGFPAAFLARVLQSYPGGGVESLLARAGVPPDRHEDVLRAVAALGHAGAIWRLEHDAAPLPEVDWTSTGRRPYVQRAMMVVLLSGRPKMRLESWASPTAGSGFLRKKVCSAGAVTLAAGGNSTPPV
jgi:hypothetical protein